MVGYTYDLEWLPSHLKQRQRETARDRERDRERERERERERQRGREREREKSCFKISPSDLSRSVFPSPWPPTVIAS
jgi:hypothetical protein